MCFPQCDVDVVSDIADNTKHNWLSYWFSESARLSIRFGLILFFFKSEVCLNFDQNKDKSEAYQPRWYCLRSFLSFWGCFLRSHINYLFMSFKRSSTLFNSLFFTLLSLPYKLAWEFQTGLLALKEVLRVTTFCKVVPSTHWALTYNQVTNFCNQLLFFLTNFK